MACSSVFVVSNSLRLRRFQPVALMSGSAGAKRSTASISSRLLAFASVGVARAERVGHAVLDVVAENLDRDGVERGGDGAEIWVRMSMQ